jgi:hypothetical protein
MSADYTDAVVSKVESIYTDFSVKILLRQPCRLHPSSKIIADALIGVLVSRNSGSELGLTPGPAKPHKRVVRFT